MTTIQSEVEKDVDVGESSQWLCSGGMLSKVRVPCLSGESSPMAGFVNGSRLFETEERNLIGLLRSMFADVLIDD